MTDATSMTQSLPHAWKTDHRDPLFTFQLTNGEAWGFYGMELTAWNELLSMMIIHALVSAMISIVVYKLVVQRERTAIAYVACYATIPMLFAIPFAAFSLFGIKNAFFRFCIGTIMPVTCLFKTTAAAHGFTPKYAKTSLKTYALFYATPMLMKHDAKLDKFLPATMSDNLAHLKGFFVMLFVTSALQSTFNFLPGLVPPLAQGQLPPDSDWYSFRALIYPQKWLVRNLIFAIYFQVKISCLAEGLILAQALVTGNQTGACMDNPVLTARSHAEFWGSKWNLVVHDALKSGVYLPVRRHFPKHVAMLSTFLASGVFHEILLHMALYPLDDSDGCLSDETAIATKVECFSPRPFTTTMFFLWQAALIALAYSPIGQLKVWSRVPDALATMYVLFAGAPLAHFFVEPYWNSLCFENASMLFFVIKPLA